MFRAIDKWLLPWLNRRVPRVSPGEPLHVFFAVCDHFEPLHDTDKAGAVKRIDYWREHWPEIVASFRDADGRGPRHTFFYPIEQYDPDLLEPLADLCRRTGSEVEVHLHHHDDTPAGVTEALERGKRDLLSHGLLSRDSEGEVRYGFIHGNWALNHSHPEGKGCGVDREIPILRRTGCYADFTMPSAPSPTQSRVVNTIGYLSDLPGRAAIDDVVPAEVGRNRENRDRVESLLSIPGPLAPNLKWRKWGLIPKLENGDLTGANPPTRLRLELAVNQGIGVIGKPNWAFVKCHTHGGIEPNFHMLLGEPMRRFHAMATGLEGRVRFHYVTAREMANLVHAAEDGVTSEPAECLDYRFRKEG